MSALLSDISIEGQTITPAFDPYTYAYEVALGPGETYDVELEQVNDAATIVITNAFDTPPSGVIAREYYTATPHSSSVTPGKTVYGCYVATKAASTSVTDIGGTLTMTVTFGEDTEVYTLHITPDL